MSFPASFISLSLFPPGNITLPLLTYKPFTDVLLFHPNSTTKAPETPCKGCGYREMWATELILVIHLPQGAEMKSLPKVKSDLGWVTFLNGSISSGHSAHNGETVLDIGIPLVFTFGRIIRNQMNRDSIRQENCEAVVARPHPGSLQGTGQSVREGRGQGGFKQARRSREGKLNDLSGWTSQALSIAMTNDLINEKMYFSWQVTTSSLCVFF